MPRLFHTRKDANMNLREIVKLLRDNGVSISYRKRNDGSIVIKTINGTKYSGKEGNEMARAMTGQQLSAAQYSQKIAAIKKSNIYENKPKRKKVAGLSQSQREFISKYNKKIQRINQKYQPKKPLQKIGAKQARAAMARGESWLSWQDRAVKQAVARAIDLPLGTGGVAERHALAMYIKFTHKNNPKAQEVARYIDTHRVSQTFLNALHDLAYRKDNARIDWDTALEKAKESNAKISAEIKAIREEFRNL